MDGGKRRIATAHTHALAHAHAIDATTNGIGSSGDGADGGAARDAVLPAAVRVDAPRSQARNGDP